jgi:hypothetical protein
MIVDNPFIFKTKTEVVSLIGQCGGSHLIALTRSCSHQIFSSKTQVHCGTCSQCIDRRIAVLAAGLGEHDPGYDYQIDVFTGARADGYAKNMAVNYARHGIELSRMNDDELASRFNLELNRAVRPFPNPREAAEQFIRLHRCHGETVSGVLTQQLALHVAALAQGTLADSSMLAMVAGQQHKVSAWLSYADGIAALLQRGLPKACASKKPATEPHLQEISDGILAAHDDMLIREFPFLRWGSVATKPDWSREDLVLWVEMKYVRDKKDIRPITKDIAEDITKYGDGGRRTLFVVYDPFHHITDEDKFSEPIVSRSTMLVRFVR